MTLPAMVIVGTSHSRALHTEQYIHALRLPVGKMSCQQSTCVTDLQKPAVSQSSRICLGANKGIYAHVHALPTTSPQDSDTVFCTFELVHIASVRQAFLPAEGQSVRQRVMHMPNPCSATKELPTDILKHRGADPCQDT